MSLPNVASWSSDQRRRRSAARQDAKGRDFVGERASVILDVRRRATWAGIGSEILDCQLQLGHAVVEALQWPIKLILELTQVGPFQLIECQSHIRHLDVERHTIRQLEVDRTQPRDTQLEIVDSETQAFGIYRGGGLSARKGCPNAPTFIMTLRSAFVRNV
jgi:hypothetical protein